MDNENLLELVKVIHENAEAVECGLVNEAFKDQHFSYHEMGLLVGWLEEAQSSIAEALAMIPEPKSKQEMISLKLGDWAK